MSTKFSFTAVDWIKISYKYWLLRVLVQCGIKQLKQKTHLIPVCQHHIETLKLWKSALVYCWFPLQQMIKTYHSTQEVPCVSVFQCITSSEACQSGAKQKHRQLCSRVCPKCYLAVFSEAEQNEIYFDIQSRPLCIHWSCEEKAESPFHPTQSKTEYLLSNHAATHKLLTLLSSFWIKKEITQESCCGLSRMPIIRRSVLLQILIKLWQLIWLAVTLDSILLNGRQSLTTAEDKNDLKHKPTMAEHTAIGWQ